MRKLLFAIAIAAAATLPTVASAGTVKPYNHSGYWTNYAGIADDGGYVCGMTAYSPTDTTRQVHVKYIPKDKVLLVQLFKNSWRIPDGTDVAIDLGFDKDLWASLDAAKGYTAQNAKLGGFVEFPIRPDSVSDFLGLFGEADEMWVRFPNGNETPWITKMVGSRDAAKSLTACMAAAPQATQPFGKAPASQRGNGVSL
jgi:hypothetical protein